MATSSEHSYDLASDLAKPAEVIRFGKDEMNLAEFPITLLTDRVPKGKKLIQYQDRIFDEKSGKHLTRKLTISADEANGLPTAVDDDVILGLIQLTKQFNNFTSREVEFNRLELIKLLGWPDSGDSYRRLATSLKRWLSVTLLYENAWRDNRQETWTTKGFHILDNIELNDGRAMSPQGELFPSKITWNKVVFESFQAGYLKTINYSLYVKLKHTIARRLYRFLDKRMFYGPELRFDLHDLAIAHVGLSGNYSGNAGKIKEKLQPALEELESVGFLEPMSKEERYRKIGKSWEIRLSCLTPIPAPSPSVSKAAPSGLAAELFNQGVAIDTATQLVNSYPAELIALKLEVLDWKMQRAKPPKESAGYLIASIKANYPVPKGFESAADRQRREQAVAKKELEEQALERQKRVDQAARRAAEANVAALQKSLTPDQLSRIEAEAIAHASDEMRANLANPILKAVRKTLIYDLVREHLARQLAAGDFSLEPA